MKKALFTMVATAVCRTMFGQSVVENLSSSTAVVIRDPARQASTDVDAAIFNPAGTALMDDGLHLSLSGAANLSTTKAKCSTGDYTIEENYVLPSFQFVYKKGDWAFSGSFASEGGFGSRNYKDGSPSIDYINGHSLIGVLKNTTFNLAASNLHLTSTLEGHPINIDANDQLHYTYRDMRSHLNNYAVRLGVAHNISNHLSAYVGLKISNLSRKYDMNPTVNVYKDKSQTEVSFADYISDAKNSLSVSEAEKNLYGEILDKLEEIVFFGIGSNQAQSGRGVAPVIGIDYNADALNLGVKFDFGSHINIGDGDCIGLPAHLSFGGSWKTTEKLKIAAGGDMCFKSVCNPMINKDDKVSWDASISAALKLSKTLEANVGYQISGKNVINEDCHYSFETFNTKVCHPSIFSTGIRYTILEGLSADLGVSIQPTVKTNYYLYSLSNTTPYEITYKQTPVKIGIGLNYSF